MLRAIHVVAVDHQSYTSVAHAAQMNLPEPTPADPTVRGCAVGIVVRSGTGTATTSF